MREVAATPVQFSPFGRGPGDYPAHRHCRPLHPIGEPERDLLALEAELDPRAGNTYGNGPTGACLLDELIH